MKNQKRKLYNIFTLTLLLFAPALYVGAMSSGNYSIPSDSINIGGLDSNSTNYSGQDTIGEVGTGSSSSASYTMVAGYQQMQGGSISISSTNDPPSSNMSGITAGEANTFSTWTVTTDNAAGYTLAVRASTYPALKSSTYGSFFADYTPSGSDPDKTFSISTNVSEFAFSPESIDVAQRYKDNGTSCNTGSLDTVDACWDGFSTSDVTVSSRTSSNNPTGSTTKVKYRSAIGSDKIQDAGAYSATITVTATTL